MGLHHFANVERFKSFEQTAPDNRHQSRCSDNLRIIYEPFWNLAARRGAAQQGAHCSNDSRQHLPIIEFGKFRKTPTFGNHEADNVFPARLVDLAHKQIDDAISQQSDRYVGLTHGLDRTDKRSEHGPDQLLKQALLVTEVEVDGSFGDACPSRDIIETRGLKSTN